MDPHCGVVISGEAPGRVVSVVFVIALHPPPGPGVAASPHRSGSSPG